MENSVDDEKIASELRGNTLRAYWALLSAEKSVLGVRELQRKLGFSSPALASYHLRKLEDLLTHLEYDKKPGDRVILNIVRDGKPITLEATLGDSSSAGTKLFSVDPD